MFSFCLSRTFLAEWEMESSMAGDLSSKVPGVCFSVVKFVSYWRPDENGYYTFLNNEARGFYPGNLFGTKEGFCWRFVDGPLKNLALG